jgi:lysophospholipase L1-like esterase
MRRCINLKNLLLPALLLAAFLAAAAEDVRLLIPEKIYAVPGVESNVYFNNVVTVINPANYVFDVDCPKGRNDLKRWRFTPGKSDVGTWKWKIRVIDDSGEVAQAESELVVLPPDVGKDRKISMLVIGASYISGGNIPFRVAELMAAPGNPEFRTIGTRGKGNARHEGYGGWRWSSFLTRWGYTGKSKNDGMHPDRPVGFNSPFIFDKDGKGVFDLNRYFQLNNGGKIPDAVSFQLGMNDVFSAKDDTIRERTKASLEGMEKLIAEFRKLQPAPEIFVCTGIPGSGQDGFGANYACGQSSWQFRKNLDFYIRALQKKSRELGFNLVPMFINVDTENNYPVRKQPLNAENPKETALLNNGIHPTRYGYFQMGDTLYCCLKAWLARTDVKK